MARVRADHHGLYQVYRNTDATLAEINPLVITGDNRLMALDGKIVLDDNALYRHADLAEMRDLDEESSQETEARKYGLSYVMLDGEIGCMVNGAGLAMGTMDIVQLFGGWPANFLDIGGGAQADKVAAALRIILSDAKVKTVLINIFGGITRCDEVAHGIIWRWRAEQARAVGGAAGRHQRRRRPAHFGRRQPDHRHLAGRRRPEAVAAAKVLV